MVSYFDEDLEREAPRFHAKGFCALLFQLRYRMEIFRLNPGSIVLFYAHPIVTAKAIEEWLASHSIPQYFIVRREIRSCIILQGDFQDEAVEQAVLAALDGPADLVLSDMAPNTTGHGPTDHLRIMGLAEIALDFAERVLKPGGGFVAKVFQGGSEAAMLVRLRQRFTTVKHAKPAASRKDSSELYVVATGFKG